MIKLTKDIKKDKKWFFVLTILLALLLFDNIFLILNIVGLHSIENLLRIVVCIIIIIFMLLSMFLSIKALIKRKKVFYIILTIIFIVYLGITGFLNINFNIIYNKLDKVSASYTTYSISLVTKSNNTTNSIDDIDDSDIGIINDHEIANGYNFGQDILKEKNKKNNLKEYASYTDIINDLLNDTIKYAFLPSNYKDSFGSIEEYSNIGNELKTIYEESKQEEKLSSNKNINEPFTVLLMGVDSTNPNIANTTANGDSLVLLTFNPKTLRATMVSIPRDSYVPIACMSNKKNKITHSAWGGETCIINTIQNFTGLTIDYYVKINFTGIVNLVNALNGIDVNVAYSFCEQNSQRKWDENTIYVEAGQQNLNGEQALAYARNRHPNPEYCPKQWTNYDSNDFIRGQHQQDIIKAILSKIKEVRDLDTFYSLLDTISNNMETNMDSNTILSFYNVAKDIVIKSKDAKSIDDLINIQKLYISGYSAMVYDYSQITNQGMRLLLYNFVPYQGSIKDIVKAMKINLEQENEDPIKTFSFDINKPYEEKIIGQGSYNEASISLLPDFTDKTESYVESYGTKTGIKITVETVNDSTHPNGTVISQDPPASMDLDNISKTKGIKITVAKHSGATTETEQFNLKECKDEKYKTDSNCKLKQNFTGKTLSKFKSYASQYGLSNIKAVIESSKDIATDNDIIKSIKVDNKDITEFFVYDLINNNKIIDIECSKKQDDDKPINPGTDGGTTGGTGNGDSTGGGTTTPPIEKPGPTEGNN